LVAQIIPAPTPKLLNLKGTIDDSPTTPGKKEDSDKGETRTFSKRKCIMKREKREND